MSQYIIIRKDGMYVQDEASCTFDYTEVRKFDTREQAELEISSHDEKVIEWVNRTRSELELFGDHIHLWEFEYSEKEWNKIQRARNLDREKRMFSIR